MKEINQGNDINKQYRKVWKNFHTLKKQAYKEIATRNS